MRPRSKSVSATLVAPIPMVESESDTDNSQRPSPKIRKAKRSSTHVNDSTSSYSAEDQLELLCQVKLQVPDRDAIPFDERMKKIRWDLIKLPQYTAAEAKDEFYRIVNRPRKFRILDEIVRESHADILPKLAIDKPVPMFTLFQRDNKEKIEAQYSISPNLKGNYGKVAGELFNACCPEKRDEYKKKWIQMKAEYAAKIKKYGLPKYKKNIEKAIKLSVQGDSPVGLYIKTRILHDPNASKIELRKQYVALPKNKKIKWILRWIGISKGEKANLEQYMRCSKVLTKAERDIYDEYEGRPRYISGYNIFMREHLNKNSLNGSVVENFKSTAIDWKQLPESERANYAAQAKEIRKNFTIVFTRFVASLPADRQQNEINTLSNKSGNNTSLVNTTISNVEFEYSDDSELDDDTDEGGETVFECNTGIMSTDENDTDKAHVDNMYTDDEDNLHRDGPAKRKLMLKDSPRKKLKSIRKRDNGSAVKSSTTKELSKAELKTAKPATPGAKKRSRRDSLNSDESLPSISEIVKDDEQIPSTSRKKPVLSTGSEEESNKHITDFFSPKVKSPRKKNATSQKSAFKKFRAEISDQSESEDSINMKSTPRKSAQDNDERNTQLKKKFMKIQSHKPPATLLEFYAIANFDGNVKKAKKSLKKMGKADEIEWEEKFASARAKYQKQFKAFSVTLTPDELSKFASEVEEE